jgi:sugar lactone lactonase YvrE
MRWLAALLLAAAAPATLFTIPAQHRLVEGIASDGKTIWVSSVLDRTIIARTGNSSRDFVLPKDVANPLGMAWDASRGWLWFATDCLDLPGAARCESGALIALDRRGRVRARFRPDQPLHSGDVSVGGGSVFVSDSRNGAVYRLRPGAKTLETLLAPGIGKSAQGSTLDPGGKRLLVADYSQGLFAIDLVTKQRTPLLEEGKPLRGLDGLIRIGESYVAIYNGGSPARLLRFRLDGDKVVDGRAIEADLPDPTQLVARGGQLLVVANAGWEAAAKPNGAIRAPAPIVSVPL